MPTRASTASLASSSAAAEALIAGRIVANTKKRYQASIKVMQVYWPKEVGEPFSTAVTTDAIVTFFGWLTDKKHAAKPAAFSTIRLYKSALVWYYKEHGLPLPADANQRVEMVLDGYQRKVAVWKLEGKMPVFEGKLHLTFEGYRLLARAFFKSSSSQMLFAWPYLVMQWNLMARATSVASLMMEHVSWETDALIVSLPKHKGDQEGTKCYPKHLYANAVDPFICPVLALAVLVFTRVLRYDPDGSSSQESLPNYRIFDGAKSESRFSDLFKKTIALLPQSEAQQLGGSKGELGTHSVRKGSVTYCGGMVNGPSPMHIYLRAGWSLGAVQDRYLFAGSGGDQMTGRVLSGLPFSESAFASLPPHLDAAAAAEVAWPTVFPLYTCLPESFKRALPYMLASISYHEEWLRANLSEMHPLFSTPLFTSGTLTSLRA